MAWIALHAFLLLGLLNSQAAAQESSTRDPLLALNGEFRKTYARSRAATLAVAGPVIVVDGDKLVLLRGKERNEVDAVPAVYHHLKAISHAALAAYLQLEGGEDVFSDERLADMRTLLDRMAAAAKVLQQCGFTAAQLVRQQKILEDTGTALTEALERRGCPPAQRTTFARKMAPALLANTTDAARAQIDGYHAQVIKWRRQLPEVEWRMLRVVVIGSQMPRKGSLAVQYFACLLGERGEGPRLVYAEALFDEQRALNLLGTHILDRGIGAGFFDDPERMERDLLANAASEYLKNLKFD
jgi:hypothetical protein